MAEQAWATGAGEQLRLDLRGGVRAVLNTGSRLVLRTSGEGRQALLEGEAYFDLDPAAHGRFEVKAGGARIRDVGTRFGVRAERDRLTVIVEEGVVGVSPAGGPERLVTAGRGLVVEGGRPSAEAGPVDVEAALAWRSGRLVFRERPLGEVISDLARYHGVAVSIPDSAVASIAVTGRLEVASLEDALEALAVAAPVRFAWPAPGRLVVERAARPGRVKAPTAEAPRPAPP